MLLTSCGRGESGVAALNLGGWEPSLTPPMDDRPKGVGCRGIKQQSVI